MADILIRGMEMPNNCAECPVLSQWDDCGINHKWKFADEFDKTKDRLPSCPLLSLPEGHGRLGDLETAEAILHNKAFDLAGTSAEYNALIWAVRQIKALPTIVPAEGGTDDG